MKKKLSRLSSLLIISVMLLAPTAYDYEEIHQIPKMPIKVDGVIYSPEEIARWNGQPLFYILDSKTKEDRILTIFTNEEDWEEYMRNSDEFRRNPEAEENLGLRTFTSNFFKDYDFGGDFLSKYPPSAVYILTGGFNDEISSVYSSADCWRTILYKHILLVPPALGMPPDTNYDDLRDIGFDDMASSLLVED